MKTEAEIRKLKANLQRLVDDPCQHSDPIAAIMCAARKEEARNEIGVLSWVLGESPEWDAYEERVAAAVK